VFKDGVLVSAEGETAVFLAYLEDGPPPPSRAGTTPMDHSYNSYSSPSSLAAYSAPFFSTLTFDQISDLDYPMISPSSALVSFVFGEEILCDAAATVILPGKVIPHIDDVLKLSWDMSAAFANGKRSVTVHFSFKSSNIQRTQRYHFSKASTLDVCMDFTEIFFTQINLFKLINNKIAVDAAQELVRHVSSLGQIDAISWGHFLQQPILTLVCGFYVTDFPLWKLSSLLGEN